MRIKAVIFFIVLIISNVSLAQQDDLEVFNENFYKGLDYFQKEDYVKARGYFEKAWEEASKLDDLNSIKSSTATVLGSTYFTLKKYKEAIPFYNEALRLMSLQEPFDE